MFKAIKRLILASASPRRKDMLENLGLDFEILAASVEEKQRDGETPEEFVRRAACDKAGEISRQHGDSWVLGADTVVVLAGRVLGKPGDAAAALAMLQGLAGRKHLVHTGVCLMNAKENVSENRVVTTEVHFSRFTDEIAAAYVATGEPLDKAGAYGIQGRGGVLVEKINGSCSNVVGLPLAETIEQLLHYKVIQPL